MPPGTCLVLEVASYADKKPSDSYEIRLSGRSLNPKAIYGVVSNNYIRNSGDGYAIFKTALNPYDFGPDVADVVAGYMIDGGPYKPYKYSRIFIK